MSQPQQFQGNKNQHRGADPNVAVEDLVEIGEIRCACRERRRKKLREIAEADKLAETLRPR